MKFKVGDKVKFIKKIHSHSNAVSVGNIYTINYVDEGTSIPYKTEEDFEWFKEEELELAQLKPFTKSDLQDGDIVTYRNGEKRAVDATHERIAYIGDMANLSFRFDSYNNNLTSNQGKEYDIIKVERPQYETVFERKEEILDKAEKRYLKGVIRPFRDKVKEIIKWQFSGDNGYFIKIKFKNNETLSFPTFTDKTMYEGMQADRSYTLEELGL